MKKILVVMILIAVIISALICANAEDYDLHGHKIHIGEAIMFSDYSGFAIATIDNQYQIIAATDDVVTNNYVIVAYDNWKAFGAWKVTGRGEIDKVMNRISEYIFEDIDDIEEWWW